jgi:3-hydroxyacyl-CoA dehydrogenase / enoyl-CoA hydratase / 3-hydroxybutyryl-CoA epimerase
MTTSAIINNQLSVDIDSEGIANLCINQVDAPTNLFSNDFMQAYVEAAQALIADPEVKGIVVTSARKDWVAGADLKFLGNPPADRELMLKGILQAHQAFRALEKSGKPFVAAINGNALGGGYELALTCHYRIAVNNPKIKIGFPEVQLGMFPGFGGTLRLPKLIGIQPALLVILQAQQLRPDKAKSDGLIDALVDSPEELFPAAKKWILEAGKSTQPWDDPKHRMPGGGLMTPNGVQTMVGGIGNLRKKTHGHYPGAQYAMSVIHDAIELPIDRALEVEARYFVKAFYSPEAKNLIRTGFFFVNEAKKGKAKPQGHEFYKVNKLGILGAGMMGAGIAYVSAKAGMEVVLKDASQENAEKGKAYSEKLLNDLKNKGRINAEQLDEQLARIHATADPLGMLDCDLVIEAVFENPQLKAQVTKETEAVLGADKIYASNTSTLPISTLAQASARPENFIGIHFFSPVDKMPLVEIIVGEKTSERAIAAAIDYVTQIDKVPIVVNDSQGFFTSRVFGTYTGEGALLLEEGVPATMIENVAKTLGMPVGPLAVTDEVSLTLGIHVMENMPKMSDSTRRMYDLYQKMVKDHGREGKKNGKGFYDYPAGGKKELWPGLKDLFPNNVDYLDKDTVGKRLLHIMALESYRCLEENVLRSTKDGDVGSLLGFGFPPYTGGVFSYMDYVGLAQFVAECDDYTQRFGARFAVPDSLRKRAAEGQKFYP